MTGLRFRTTPVGTVVLLHLVQRPGADRVRCGSLLYQMYQTIHHQGRVSVYQSSQYDSLRHTLAVDWLFQQDVDVTLTPDGPLVVDFTEMLAANSRHWKRM